MHFVLLLFLFWVSIHKSMGAQSGFPKAQSSVQFTYFSGLPDPESITLLSLNMPWAHYFGHAIWAELRVLERKRLIPWLK